MPFTIVADAGRRAHDVPAVDKAMYLKLFSGEVLNAYDRKTLFAALTKRVVISSGKEYQWPATGRLQASYHVPGTESVGQATEEDEVIIGVDHILEVPLFFANIWEKMSHYNYRAEYAAKSGEALAYQEDLNIACELIKAARSAAILPNHGFGGTQIENDKFKIAPGGAADNNEMAAALYEAIYAMAQVWDEKDVPPDNRHLAINPQRFYGLLKAVQTNGFSVGNRDFFPEPGDLNKGILPKIAGITIHKHNRLPTTNITTGYHQVDARKTVGIGWTPDAVGTVVLMGLQVKTEEQVRAHGDYMTTFFCEGHGVLRPECAIELKLKDLNN